MATQTFYVKSMMGFLSLLVLIYCAVMLFYTFRFKAFEPYDLKNASPQKRFSILIPFRNEAKYLPQILKSLSKLNYPEAMFEILLIDDHSEDDSIAICEQWKTENTHLTVSILKNQNLAKSPKKSAILTALNLVNYEYVLTTDADCLLPEDWLMHFDQHLQQTESHLVAGPVKIIEETGFWSKFQVLDMMSLQVIGLGSFKTASALFCNAANLCYKTETLKSIQAFERHKDIISGDDVLNLENFQEQGKLIDAIVHNGATVWTKAEKDFKSLTQQRVRWASKAKYYNNTWLVVLGLVVLLTNFSLVFSMVLAASFESHQGFYWLWLFKLSIDFYVLYVGNQFFKISLCLRDYFIMLLVYPFLSVYFACLSFTGKFSWKGRKHRT